MTQKHWVSFDEQILYDSTSQRHMCLTLSTRLITFLGFWLILVAMETVHGTVDTDVSVQQKYSLDGENAETDNVYII